MELRRRLRRGRQWYAVRHLDISELRRGLGGRRQGHAIGHPVAVCAGLSVNSVIDRGTGQKYD
ncbi:MAG TPA: hypothetical protein VL128_03410 [Candidatus Eisenbacteria bacterium]|nr:hypothetical protein [Candidatus Eisenbacteria bacterium]